MKLINADVIQGLQTIEDKTVDTCVTSPPYFGLRDYGHDGQIGLEESPEEYVQRLVEIFREVKRVLKDDGTLWLNLGDSYAGSKKGRLKNGSHAKSDSKSGKYIGQTGGKLHCQKSIGLPSKNLIGIPWRVAFALQADGWYLRQDIIWHKTNPMPESVKDRCTKSHEYIFLLSKRPKYYFDAEAISEPVADSSIKRLSQDIENQKGSQRVPGKTNGAMKAVISIYGGKKYTQNSDEFNRTKSGNMYEYRPRRNKRSVWSVSTKPYKETHFAVFPPDLIEPCILAGSREGGIVIDPFSGSGTTGVVAKLNNREYIGIDINPDYIKLSENRIQECA